MTLIAYTTPRHEDLQDGIFEIIQEDNDQFSRLFLNHNMAATNTKAEWVDKPLKGQRGRLNEALDSSETGIDISEASSKRIVVGATYIKIDDEIMGPVSAVSTNTLTVTRGALGTTAASHVTGADVHFFMLHEEGADNTRDDSQSGTKKHNFTWIGRRELKLSRTSQLVNSVGNDNAWASQTRTLMRELMQELRNVAVSGTRYADADESLRLMGGLSYYVSNAKDMGESAISTSMINSQIIELLENGVNASQLVMLTNSTQIARINDMKVARVTSGGMPHSDNTLRQNVDYYEFSDANVQIVRVPEIPRNEIYIVDKSRISICPLKGGSFKVEDIGKVGDSVQKLLVGEYTMKVGNGPEAHIRLKNLAI